MTKEILSQLREALAFNAAVLGASQLAPAHFNNFLRLFDELERIGETNPAVKPLLYSKTLLRDTLETNQRGRPLLPAIHDSLNRILDAAETEKIFEPAAVAPVAVGDLAE
jgi:hypothetical protein